MLSRSCAWCRGPLPAGARRDAITCSKRCRQARARFNRDVGPGSPRDTSAPLRLAYADPPYPGLSRRYYEGHPDFAGEVDHAQLIGRLCSDFDGWALSTSARALQGVLALCPPDVAVASWHRGERPTRSARPLNGWEPVIYWGGRLDPDLSLLPADATCRAPGGRDASSSAARDMSSQVLRDVSHRAGIDLSRVDAATRRASSIGPALLSRPDRRVDYLEHFSRPRLTDPDRVVGAKPARFASWIFALLGAKPQDHFTDLFPGSGGILRAWRIYSGATPSSSEAAPVPDGPR